ncbi:MAG: hypothetical protein HQ501_13960 [Rhodospirillales bacterium]|nr:hypothetical protein [Rhodospirillales bacterium]
MDDDLERWPVDGRLLLDGFVYDELAPMAEHKATSRLQWIRGQLNPNDTFTPRPYEQLIKVLRVMGHDRDARDVAIAKQDDLRKSGTLSLRAWLWNFVMGKLVGHGYLPWQALYFALLAILFGWAVFATAIHHDAMRPSKERITMSAKYQIGLNNGVIWTPPDYPEFNAFVYSADVFLPIVDFHQESYWLPVPINESWLWGRWYEMFLWLYIALGWIITTLGVLGLTSIVKKDKD